MPFRLTIRRAALAALALTAAAPAGAQSMFNAQFEPKPTVKSVTDQGVTVTLTPTVSGEGDVSVATTVKVDGMGTLNVPEDEELGGGSFPRVVGIGKLAATDPVASVLLQGYTGGAHCCASIRAVTPVNGKMKVVSLGLWDGDFMTEFPTDQNDDGIVDFQFRDNRFLYSFSSYAGSFAPPQFWNVQNGEFVDISTDPKFAGWYENFMPEAKEACADKSNEDRNGACIAYVAAAARIGKFDEAMAEAERDAAPLNEFSPTDCKVALVDNACPDDQVITFKNFGEAARWFLRQNGYID